MLRHGLRVLTGLLLLGAIALGSAAGILAPGAAGPAAEVADPLILALVTLLLVGLRVGEPGALRLAPRTVLIACGFNFLLIPVVAFAISGAVMIDAEALRVGVLLYCLFPCTDWFLGFTRLAAGDTTVGAALIPIQMAIQLALYPLYLHLLTDSAPGALGFEAWSALVSWFALPAGLALGVRVIVRGLRHRAAERALLHLADSMIPVVLALVVASIFVAHVGTVAQHPLPFLRVLATVFCFLAATFVLAELVTRRMALSHPQRALVVMTTSARNAPLVLALTLVALPDQPLVHTAIVLGMLVEFPHLMLLQQLLRRSLPTPPRSPEPQAHAVVG